MRHALVIVLASCGSQEIVIVPVIDSPTNATAAVLADLTSLTVTVSHASGGVVKFDSFERGSPIELSGIQFADDLVIQIDGFIAPSTDQVAIGRTCPFELSPTADPPTPHLFLSKIQRVATLDFKTEVRANGAALAAADGTVLLLGGDNATTLERFDPLSGVITREPGVALQPRTQAAIARLGTTVQIPVVVGGIVDGAGVATGVEVIDLASHSVSSTPDDMFALTRAGVVATELTDGRILVTGGQNVDSPPNNKPSGSVVVIKLQDGATKIELQADTLHPRAGHSALRLGDDDGAPVLIIGGIDNNGVLVPETELYTPLNDNIPPFKPVMITPRMNHSAVRLSDNSVVVLGGIDAAGAPVRTLERFSFLDGFNPIGNTFPAGLGVVDFSVTPLPDGRVLLTGGRNPPDPTPQRGIYTVSFNPNTDSVTIDRAPDELSVGRANHQAVLLCDGTVLITGGTDSPSVAERFNPNTLPKR